MKKKLEESCNFPKNEKLQFSSSFFHFFFILFSFVFIFLSFFYHSSSFLLPVVQKCSKKWKITIFLEFFSFFSFFFIFFHVFIIFHHFCFQWCKNFPRNGKLQFSSSFLHFVYHFFIIFASSGGTDEK